MIVRVLKAKSYIKGKVGQDIEVSDTLGSAWACQGLVRVVSHTSSKGRPKSVVRKTREAVRHIAKRSGEELEEAELPPQIITET